MFAPQGNRHEDALPPCGAMCLWRILAALTLAHSSRSLMPPAATHWMRWPVDTRQNRRSIALQMSLQPRPLSSASSEFLDVAQAQFSMLGSSGLQISRAAVYLRREDDAGVLEFFPVAVWPEQGVRVVGDMLDQGLATIPTLMLPGGATAESLLPRYPFVERGSSTMADAGLSVPLVYKHVVLGVLAVWRQDGGGSSEAEWSSAQRNMLEQVARTLAIAAIAANPTFVLHEIPESVCFSVIQCV